MNHRKTWIVLALLIALTVTALPYSPAARSISTAHAQTGGGPLVILKDGDLWRWDGSTLAQLSTWGYNRRPVLSPDGARVAYSSWATITVNAIAAGHPVLGLVASNIWVMDIATADAFRAADQPADARFFQSGVEDRVVMRGTPEWSPDGTRLAWVELLVPENRYQLVIYSFNTGATQVIVSGLPYPFADGGFVPVHDVMWGSRGLLVRNASVNSTSHDFEETAYLYAPDGTLIHQEVIGSSSTEWVFNAQWVSFNGQQYLGLHYPSGKIYLMDPATGDRQDMPALPELHSRAAPDRTTAIVAPSIDADQGLVPTWTAIYPSRQQDQLLSFNGEPKNIAISPDGQALAYISDALYIWQNGALTQVPGTDGIASPWDVAVVWGTNGWRVRTDWPGTGGGVGGAPVACTLTPRLIPGQTGQVTPGLPNALRSQPRRGSDSLIYGYIPGSATFNVRSGPVCDNEGRYWWEVTYQGTTGWTPEGEGYTYWLQPYQASPPPPVCGPAPRLTAGSTAYVLPGLPNLLRSQPHRGPGSAIVGRIPGNGIFTVLNGPQCGPEGHYWWQVNYAGIVGWTAEGQGNAYWTAPFGCPLSPPPRLAPGMQAVVTPGLPNTLRSGPGTQYGEVTSIPAGGIMTVLSGPQCGAEGWSYWRVQYGMQIGWTAEGGNGAYWLTPVSYTPPTPQPVACTLPPRMINGAAGRVIPGPDNVLRSQPRRGPDSTVLGEIPGGAVFAVENGPVCDNEGRYWWQVQYMGVRGWTAEGEGSTYWIEPWTGAPTPTPQPVGCTLAPRLQVNTSAYVTPGASNVVRSNPGTGANSTVIGQIPGGEFFYVLGGPQCGNDGRYWYRVDYQGTQGWTAEGETPNYWTAPFTCANSRVTRLVPGTLGRVTPGDPNTLRTTATGGTVIGQIPGGATFEVLSGPQCGSGGRAYWQVRYNGQVGWTAEGEGSVYWLEPVR